MKKRPLFSICLLLLIGVCLMLTSSCSKTSNTFTDPRDGTVYKTVTIGDQVWMAENLKYLPSVVGPEIGFMTTPCYYVYDYYGTDVDEAKATDNYTIYGVLYNWPAAMNGEESSTDNPSNVQGVCPTGWHLPSDAEWTQLIDYLVEDAGGKLKAPGTSLWNEPNSGATNETGFTALPSGGRNFDGTFLRMGNFTYWWSATEINRDRALHRQVGYDYSTVNRNDFNKYQGLSVRCVKDN